MRDGKTAETALFCDCETDAERAAFFASGRAFETGVVAAALSDHLADAYRRLAQLARHRSALDQPPAGKIIISNASTKLNDAQAMQLALLVMANKNSINGGYSDFGNDITVEASKTGGAYVFRVFNKST